MGTISYTTLILASVFLIIKGFEYAAKISHGYLPAKFFTAESIHESLHLFFGLYYITCFISTYTISLNYVINVT